MPRTGIIQFRRLAALSLAMVVIGLFLSVSPARAFWITNLCTADASLIEVAPTNNNGGEAWVLSGRTQNGPRNRGLYRFDLTNLPPSAVIQAATLVLHVTRVPSEPANNSAFGLRRMLRPWGEGDKAADGISSPGRGLPAAAGQATWEHAFFPTNEWSAPGGVAGADFSSVESAFQFISGIDTYRFESTPELVADLQDWVIQPQINFGWLLLCGSEDIIFTARRFGAREDPDAQPILEIQCLVPPLIEAADRVGDEFHLRFVTWPGQTYAVEYRPAIDAGNWQSLTNTGIATNLTSRVVVDSASAPQRLYRVVAN